MTGCVITDTAVTAATATAAAASATATATANYFYQHHIFLRRYLLYE